MPLEVRRVHGRPERPENLIDGRSHRTIGYAEENHAGGGGAQLEARSANVSGDEDAPISSGSSPEVLVRLAA